MDSKLIEKGREAKTSEELKAMAAENGVSLSEAEAEKYYAALHSDEQELSDEELGNVSGGGCYSAATLSKEYQQVSPTGTCEFYKPCFSEAFGKASNRICSKCANSWKAKGQELYYCDNRRL